MRRYYSESIGNDYPELQNLIGQTIRIDYMEGEPQYTGKVGVVELVDDIGQLHGTWGGCAVVPEYDEYTVITNESYRRRDNRLTLSESIFMENTLLEKKETFTPAESYYDTYFKKMQSGRVLVLS